MAFLDYNKVPVEYEREAEQVWKMKKVIYLLLVCLVFSGCTHRIARTGYEVKKSDYTNCDVLIQKGIIVPDSIAIQIGEIKLGETGVSVACSEKHALKLLQGEACAIDADIIVITEENRPDAWSSCYRCRAKFYQYLNPEVVLVSTQDDLYDLDNVDQRVSKDRKKNTAIVIGAVIAGVIVGLLFVSL